MGSGWLNMGGIGVRRWVAEVGGVLRVELGVKLSVMLSMMGIDGWRWVAWVGRWMCTWWVSRGRWM